MKLVEALRIIQAPRSEDAAPFPVYLACGFEPLHLKTFLTAHLRQRLPTHAPEVQVGLYGDNLGNLRRSLSLPLSARVVVLEWADLDPRLGIRDLGGWRPDDLPDMLRTAAAALRGWREALAHAGELAPVALSLPTLPLPPLWYTPSVQCGRLEAELQAELATFAAEAAGMPGVRLLSRQRLDAASPPDQRRDVKSEFAYGYPYQMAHGDLLAELLATLVAGAPPKKGIITDLDDTLWRGLVGEVGAAGVTWDLATRSHIHALYQQLLASLAEAGVLVAIASKNDAALVAETLERDDLLLSKKQLFPVEVHWQPKSESVARILAAWNIGADSVIFVDDSPLELAEVQTAFPQIEGFQFPTHDDQSAYILLERLRSLFGKERVGEEDRLRAESLRSADAVREVTASEGEHAEEFLSGLNAQVTLSWARQPADPRALELVNKTNQFNLNGRRHTEHSWQTALEDPQRFLLVVSYQDKFGSLGKIAVLAGCRDGERAVVDTWVLSCRAFARRIEHRTLEALFGELQVQEVEFDFLPTLRNGPTQEFLTEILGATPDAACRISASRFQAVCPPLYHELKIVRE
jgi:FkbH-like protein